MRGAERTLPQSQLQSVSTVVAPRPSREDRHTVRAVISQYLECAARCSLRRCNSGRAARPISPAQVDPRSEADMHLLLKYTTVLLACEDDEPVGYASFYTRGPFLHLEEIAVRRDRQRRGCGRALAQQVLAEARADLLRPALNP